MKTQNLKTLTPCFCAFLFMAFSFNLSAQWLENANGIHYPIGNVGIGLNLPTARLDVFDGHIQVAPSTDNHLGLTMLPNGGGQIDFRTFVNSTNNSLAFDWDMYTPTDSTAAMVRFFRRTNTSGSKRVDFLRGNNTTQVDSRISVDGRNSFFNRYGGNVGIGTSNPKKKLHVNGDVRVKGNFQLRSSNNHTMQLLVDNAGDLIVKRDQGITAMTIRDDNGYVGIGTLGPPQHRLHVRGTMALVGKLGIGFPTPSLNAMLNVNGSANIKGDLRLRSSDDAESFQMTVGNNGNLKFIRDGGNVAMVIGDKTGIVGIGSNITSLPSGYRLAVDGKIKCREVRVTNIGWADFVFDEEYQLPSLEKVEQFIQANRHLPDVPSEKEVLQNGTDLGEMDAILLQKIEELTLYMIELKKENKVLRQEIELVKN